MKFTLSFIACFLSSACILKTSGSPIAVGTQANDLCTQQQLARRGLEESHNDDSAASSSECATTITGLSEQIQFAVRSIFGQNEEQEIPEEVPYQPPRFPTDHVMAGAMRINVTPFNYETDLENLFKKERNGYKTLPTASELGAGIRYFYNSRIENKFGPKLACHFLQERLT
eukprot:Pgem_evm1s8800